MRFQTSFLILLTILLNFNASISLSLAEHQNSAIDEIDCKSRKWGQLYNRNFCPVKRTKIPKGNTSQTDQALQKNNSSPSKLSVLIESDALPSSPDSMPSYAEWMEKSLSEAEEQNRNNVLAFKEELQISNQVESQSQTNFASEKIVPERALNYASYECGAIVIDSNREAEHKSRLLNDNIDEYVLNPCEAKKWFVVKLCEFIQPAALDLANWELFSSNIKEFSVYASNYYPTKQWHHLGTFIAEDVRKVQRFNFINQVNYFKYLKIEQLSHHRNEYYCPLSVIRVYGISVAEELDVLQSGTNEMKRIEIDLENIPLSNPVRKNLFGSTHEDVHKIIEEISNFFQTITKFFNNFS